MDGAEVLPVVTVWLPFPAAAAIATMATKNAAVALRAVRILWRRGHDFRALLRGGASDEELAMFLDSLWSARTDRYSEERGKQTETLPKVEMSHIGG